MKIVSSQARRSSRALRWLTLAAGLTIAAAPPGQRMYLVGCDGQVDRLDLTTGVRLRSIDVARNLPIARSQMVAGATFDGCLLNQAVYVPARGVFYSVVPDQFSYKSDGTKDYHIFSFTVPGLQPKRLASAGTSLDEVPRLIAARDGTVGIASRAPNDVGLSSFAQGMTLQSQILESSGGRFLVSPSGQRPPALAVIDVRRRSITTLVGLPVDAARNAHLSPGGTAVYVEEVTKTSRKTGRAFLFDAATGRLVKTIIDKHISTMMFVALAPNGKVVYRHGDRYALVDASGEFTGTPVVRSIEPSGPPVFFTGK